MFDRLKATRESHAHGDQAGFTLIELLIVIVVLAILAAVVIFGLSGLTGQSAQSACNADAKTVEIAVEAYHAQLGQWPTQNQLTTVGVNGSAYLRTFPNNPNHYVIFLGPVQAGPVSATAAPAPDGSVFVQPDNGSAVAVVATPAPAIAGGGYNYDGTATLTAPAGGATSTNPCAFVA